MKSVYIVGNWKSNKTLAEAKVWIENFAKYLNKLKIPESQKIIICAPFTLLEYLKEEIKKRNLPITLGAENVSAYPSGAYTGEINAHQVKELASWVIIGHSERRKNLGETDKLLELKVKEAKAENLKVIYCVQNENNPVPPGVDLIGYEPPWAISAVSGGKSQSPQQANEMITKIKQKFSNLPVLYGGSVNPDNISDFINSGNIDGVLVGGVSLEPFRFSVLIKRIIENKD